MTDTYTLAGQISGETPAGALGTTARAYTYDGVGRVATAGSLSYAYDLAGNPTGLGASTQTFTGNDELVTATSPAAGVSFDAGGTRTAVAATGAGQTSLASFTDQATRLTAATSSVIPTATAAPAAVTMAVRNPTDQAVYVWGPGQSGWTTLGGQVSTNPVVVTDTTRTHIIAMGTNGRLYHRTTTAGWVAVGPATGSPARMCRRPCPGRPSWSAAGCPPGR